MDVKPFQINKVFLFFIFSLFYTQSKKENELFPFSSSILTSHDCIIIKKTFRSVNFIYTFLCLFFKCKQLIFAKSHVKYIFGTIFLNILLLLHYVNCILCCTRIDQINVEIYFFNSFPI